ncbi:hypothetical protein FNZ56_08565 [Pseudoluteimonas lycopersici]|uniref:HEPN AbiU2-like domain-containing protein n=1 Tax=Pseudoluteimonas lycopersici TaxID=1324796 RepID=A0A516V5W5_9GAMM|nr:hypothetical protein [Lysobacter lycopersici]QDQ73924.1 hypothetical protein FNZ56_08565 [Lysobacter lycopersici]
MSAIPQSPNVDAKDVDAFWRICNQAYELWRFQQALENNPSLPTLLSNQWLGWSLARIQGVLIDETLLQIARLHDRAKFGQRYNLCIEFMVSFGKWPAETKKALEGLKQSLDELASHLLDARKWLLAHNDRETHREDATLGFCSSGTYETYFLRLQDFVNTIDLATNGSGIRPFVEITGNDMDGMIGILMRGLDD